METISKPRILVIVGPTASGKTGLSIDLAKKFNGEVISADSRQVYQGLDLGTGKVTTEEMRDIPHHLLSVTSVEKVYSAADFKRDAEKAIDDILTRGKLPVIVGGTFFYVDMLLGKTSAPAIPPDSNLRDELETLSTDELLARLAKKDSERAASIDAHNRRRLIRAIEITEAMGHVPPIEHDEHYNVLTLGISISKENLHKNIHDRLLSRIEAGMVNEVKALIANGVGAERLHGLGLEYRYISKYLHNELTHDEMCTLLETKIRQFAKRQMTWLKRDTDIVWVDPKDTGRIEELVGGFLG